MLHIFTATHRSSSNCSYTFIAEFSRWSRTSRRSAIVSGPGSTNLLFGLECKGKERPGFTVELAVGGAPTGTRAGGRHPATWTNTKQLKQQSHTKMKICLQFCSLSIKNKRRVFSQQTVQREPDRSERGGGSAWMSPD